MTDQEVTTMVLKVDLQCPHCYKKIKKVLCKFPEIRDQVYDDKQNTVTITVVSCNPEKIRDKLCCKGGKAIQSIDIKPPPKPKEPEKPKKPKEPEKPPEKQVDKKPKEVPESDPPKVNPPAPTPPTPEPVMLPAPVCGYPPYYPGGVCCGSCYEGSIGGPCYHGYGRPTPPPPCYDNYGFGHYGYGRGCYVRNDYFSEENPSACTIM